MNDKRMPNEYMDDVLYFAVQTAKAKDFEYANEMRVIIALSLKELEYLRECVIRCGAKMEGEQE